MTEMEIEGLEPFMRRLNRCTDKEVEKKVKKFMRLEGNKLKRRTLKVAKSKVGKKTGNFYGSIKRGKIYKLDGAYAIRAYSTAPHAHLIEYGHKTKNGGFVPGKDVFRSAEAQFSSEYFEHIDQFIDQLLDEGLGF